MLSSVRRLLNEFAPVLRHLPSYRRSLVVGLVAIPVSRALDLLIPWIVGRTVDDLAAGVLARPLSVTVLVLLALATLKGGARFVMRHQLVGASRRIERDFRTDLYRHVLSLPTEWFRGMRSGDLMARLVWDVEAVRVFLGPGMMYLTETVFMLPAVLVLLWIDPWLAALLLVPLLAIVAAMKRYAPAIHAEATAAQRRLSDLSSVAQEDFAGVRIVRSFAREDVERARFARSSAEYRDRALALARLRGANWTLLLAAKDLGMLVVVVGGCARLASGAITIGDLWLFVLYLAMLFWPMVALGWMAGMAQRARASMARLSEILAVEPALAPPKRDGDLVRPHRLRGAVRFESVTVERGGRTVLLDVDIDLAPGQVLGVTGATGAGKTTLVSTLVRLVAITSGRLLVDGTPIERIDPTVLRRRIGFVPQEAFLFADTIRSNVALGCDGEDDEAALRRALESARVLDDVLALEGGLDAVVGERGVTLSGGQRQRITLARALASDPDMLVLDDALSAVDADTEAEILANLARAFRGRTAILVSHRPAALLLADEVVVLDEGRIVERGAPARLLEKKGRFHALWLRQRAERELEELE